MSLGVNEESHFESLTNAPAREYWLSDQRLRNTLRARYMRLNWQQRLN